MTIADDTSELMATTGLSMAAHARVVIDPSDADSVLRMLLSKYPGQASFPVPMSRLQVFRVTPTVISVIHAPTVPVSPHPGPARTPRRIHSAHGSLIFDILNQLAGATRTGA